MKTTGKSNQHNDTIIHMQLNGPSGQCPSKQSGITIKQKRHRRRGTKAGSNGKRKQVIVNNYYINDRKEGWKQLEKGEILPNILKGKTHRNSSEISQEKSCLGDLNIQSGVEKEIKNLD